jgi:TonB family protein
VSLNHSSKSILGLFAILLVLPSTSLSGKLAESLPPQAAEHSTYSDDTDGLRQVLLNMLEVAKNDNIAQLKALIKESEIPNSDVWFTTTFGKEKGESWAGPYGKMLEENEAHFQELMVRLAHQRGDVSVQKLDATTMFDTLTTDLDLFLAHWNPSETNKDQEPIGYFFFIDGRFRWDSTIMFVRLQDMLGPASNQADSAPPTAKPGLGGVAYPSCVYCPPAEFPKEARKAKDHAVVLLKAVIRTDGHVANIEIVRSGGSGFDEKAIEAVRRWRFKPAMGPNGIPVPVAMPIEVTFYSRN